MNKYLLFFAAMLCSVAMYADSNSVTITFSDLYSANTKLGTVEVNSVKVTFSKGTGTTDPQYYTNGTAMRVYQNNTITIATTNDADIEYVNFTHPAKTYSFGKGNDITANVAISHGSITAPSDTKTSWTSSGTSKSEVTFTLANGLSASRISSMEIGLSGGSSYTMEAPWFDTPEGDITDDDYIVISSNDGNIQNIYYTIDGSDPKDGNALTYEMFGMGFKLDHSATVKARPYGIDNSWGPLIQATYTYVHKVNNIAEFLLLNDGERCRFENAVVGVYQNDLHTYTYDDTGFMLIYGSLGQTVQNGMSIPAGLKGSKTTYHGLIEMVPDATSVGTPYGGASTFWPSYIEGADVTTDLQNKWVIVRGTVKSVSGKNVVFTAEDGTELVAYNRFSATVPTVGEITDMSGFVAVYDSSVQIYPTEFVVDTYSISFTPEAGVYYKPQTVTASFSTAAGEPLPLSRLVWVPDEGETVEIVDESMISGNYIPFEINIESSGTMYAYLKYYSSQFSMEREAVDSARYEVIKPLELVFSPEAGDYSDPITVKITPMRGDKVSDETIYYVLGAEPDDDNALVYDPEKGIELWSSSAITAWVDDKYGARTEQTNWYNVVVNMIYPNIDFSHNNGTFYEPQEVTITVSNAYDVYYWMEYSNIWERDPNVTVSDTTHIKMENYSEEFINLTIDRTGTLKVRAIGEYGLETEDSRNFYFPPKVTFTPEGSDNMYFGGVTVKVNVTNFEPEYTISYAVYDESTEEQYSSTGHNILDMLSFTPLGNDRKITLTVDEYGDTSPLHIYVKVQESENAYTPAVSGQYWLTAPAESNDINSDGIRDVADVVALSNVVMGEDPEVFNDAVCDVNEDNIKDVADVVSIANLIMGAE